MHMLYRKELTQSIQWTDKNPTHYSKLMPSKASSSETGELFQRAVKAVFARSLCQLFDINIRDLRMGTFAPLPIIPAQPGCAEVGEVAGWRGVEDCVTFKHETLFAKAA